MAMRFVWRAALIATLLVPSGCAFMRLHHDVTRLEALAFIGGHVAGAPVDMQTIVVLSSADSPGTIIDAFILTRPGPYFFQVPAGRYRLAAFVDVNHDFVYQSDTEAAAYYGAPSDVLVAPGQRTTNLDFAIGGAPRVRLDFPVDVANMGNRGTRDLPAISLGEIVKLDDARFSEANPRSPSPLSK